MSPVAVRVARGGASALIMAFGIALFAAGVSPWPAPVLVGIGLACALRSAMRPSAAVASAAVIELLFVALAVQIAPAVRISYPLALTLGLTLLGAVAALVIGTREIRLPSPRGLALACVIAVLGAVTVAATSAWLWHASAFAWAMRNDSVWNLVSTRFVIADGGIGSGAHPNPAPLTPALFAAVIGAGRTSVPARELLAHDVSAFAALWMALSLITSLLAALCAVRATGGAGIAIRLVAAATCGALPLLWFALGVAVDFGFWNATLALLLLLAAWILWLEASNSAVVMLGVVSVCLLATWGPLVLIPLALTALAGGLRIIRLRKDRRALQRALVGALVAFGIVGVYGLLVTLPDLRREGAALAVDGGFIAFGPLKFSIIVVAAVVVALVAPRRSRLGVVAVSGAAGVAVGYLLLQRAGAKDLWGYYPAKLAWLCALLLLVITAAALFGTAARRTNPWRTLIAAAGVVSAPLLMNRVPPSDGWSSAFTPVAAVWKSTEPALADAVRHVFAEAEPGTPTILMAYGTRGQDAFGNTWLLQLESTSSQEPIRQFAYLLDPESPSQVCDAVHAWKRHVRVITADPQRGEELANLCGTGSLTIELRSR